MAPNTQKQDPKAAAKEAAAKAKEAAAKKKADEASKANEAKDKAAKAAAAAEAKKKEREEAAEAKKKEKEAEKAAKAEAREADKAQREALKGGPGKRLRSLIARIKYMIYMDNPSAGIENIELLAWTLTLTNSEGTIYTITRGETTEEIAYSIKPEGKKAVTGTCGVTQEELEAVVGEWTP